MTTVKILTAIENKKVKECIVIPEDECYVSGLMNTLVDIYGGENVCLSSCKIGHIPDNISRYIIENYPRAVPKRNEWIYYSKMAPSIGSRLLVKLSNGWVCIATYMNGDAPGTRIWKADNGEQLISVVSWKELG